MSTENKPIDPEAAQLLQTVREALGLSVNQMAQALGMQGEAAGDNVRQMERGKRAISGPIHVLLRYMAPSASVTPGRAPDGLAFADAVRVRLRG